MGIYKVQSNGKAPVGLSVGDQVVTGGGTYLITAVAADGGYTSVMYDAKQNTGNYSGRYDLPGGGSGNPVSDFLSSGGSAEEYYTQLLGQTLNTGYTPAASGGSGGISFDEAVRLAGQSLQPQYEQAYQQAADNAAQRLEKAGLYDSLYGQALAAQAESKISQQLNAAIQQLALELTRDSASLAQKTRAQDASENLAAAKLTAQQQETVLNYLLKLINAQQKAAQQAAAAAE